MADVAELRAVLTAQISDLQKEFKRAADAVKSLERSSTRDLTRVNTQLNTLSRTATTFGRVFVTALGGTAILRGVKSLVDTADAATLLNARLKVATGGGQAFAEAQAGVVRVANETRQSIEGTAEVYTRLANATKDLGVEQSTLITAVETLNKAVVVSGASAQEAQAALIQLSQGMASGRLQGEELRAVLEQLPIVARLISKETGIAFGDIRTAAAEGRIGVEDILNALVNGADEIDAQFKEIPSTVGQALTLVSNALFEAVKELDAATGATSALAGAITAVATAVPGAVSALRDFDQQAGVLANTLRFLDDIGAFTGTLLATPPGGRGIQPLLDAANINEAVRALERASEAGARLTEVTGRLIAQDLFEEFRAEVQALDELAAASATSAAAAREFETRLAALKARLPEVEGETKKLGGATDKAGKDAEKAEKQYAKLSEKLGKDLVEATQKARGELEELIEGLRFEAATAGMTDIQRELAQTAEEVRRLGFEAGLTGEEIDAMLDDASALVLEKRMRELGNTAEDVGEDVSRVGSAIGEAFEEAIAGVLSGTRDLEDIGDLFKDVFAGAFADTIKEKLKFDKLFEGNIFDLVGDIGKFLLGDSSGLVGRFSAAFGDILGDKKAFDAAFAGRGGGGGGGSSLGSDVLLGTGGAGGAAGLVEIGPLAFGPSLNLSVAKLVVQGILNRLGLISGPPLYSQAGSQVAAQAGSQIAANTASGTTAGTTAGAGSGAGALGTLGTSLAQITVVAGLLLNAAFQAKSFFKGDQSFLATSMNLALDPLGLVGSLGFSPASVLGQGGPVLSKDQLTRRFLVGDVLRPSASVGAVIPEDVPFRASEAIGKFPDLAAAAGDAVTAFGVAFGQAVKTPLDLTDELRNQFNILIGSFGEAGIGGEEGIVRTAALMKELGLDAGHAGALIEQAFEEGKIDAEQFQRAIKGLGDITNVTTDQMVETLKADLGEEALGVFARLRDAGVDSFAAVATASDTSFLSIAATMSNDMLPRAAAIFEALRALGINSAEAIAAAFARAFNFKVPGSAGGEGFINIDGKLVYVKFGADGSVTPIPAPELTPKQAREVRREAPKLPAAQIGGTIERSGIAVVHRGEEIVTKEIVDRLEAILGKGGLTAQANTSPNVVVAPVMEPANIAQFIRRARRTGHTAAPITPTLGITRR